MNEVNDGRLLSTREAQVLTLMAHGLSTKSIAAEMGVSPSTVRSYGGRIVCKLGAFNRVHAIAVATRLGEIDPL